MKSISPDGTNCMFFLGGSSSTSPPFLLTPLALSSAAVDADTNVRCSFPFLDRRYDFAI